MVAARGAAMSALERGPVAVLGFGNQGGPQARMLRASGLEVRVGARLDHESAARARAQGFDVRDGQSAVRGAATLALMLPDEAVPDVWKLVEPAIEPGAAVVFAHGYSLLYGELSLERTGDVVLVSPAGPGRLLEPAPDRAPLSAYLAVHREATGGAWALAEDYARRLGCAPTWRTTVREETEVDLFGEQAVLCGGMNALVRAAFEVLTEAGYSPEIAYLECVHQLKHLADLLHERGVQGLRRSISGTALFGDVTRGPRVIGESTRTAMREILGEIRSGEFAREWDAEVAAGRPRIRRAMAEGDGHPMEAVRRRIVPGAGSSDGPDSSTQTG